LNRRRTNNQQTNIHHVISNIKYLVYFIFLQTPVFKGEEKSQFEEIKKLILAALNSKIFFFLVIGIIIVISLLIMYNRKKSIPELTIQIIPNDTWFVTRDDNNRVGIVVSVSLNNKSPRGIRVTDCRLSGYKAKQDPPQIILKDPEKKLDFPDYKHFYKGQEFYLGPFSTESLWFYYESRMITMNNLLETPLIIKDSDKRRKMLRLRIPRHADQMAVYAEMSRMW